jgi:hypothetical protein
MRRSFSSPWHKLAIVILTLPLLATSCVEMAQRTLINGFFDAVTPLADARFEDRLAELFANIEQP